MKHRQRRCKKCEDLFPREELNKLAMCGGCSQGYTGKHKRSRCKKCSELFDPLGLNVDSFCWKCLGYDEPEEYEADPEVGEECGGDDYEPPCNSCFQYGCWGCNNKPPVSRVPVTQTTRKRRK